jgi:hypothetical protein
MVRSAISLSKTPVGGQVLLRLGDEVEDELELFRTMKTGSNIFEVLLYRVVK